MEINSNYVARCHKRLKQWGAPLKDWYCVQVIDMVGEHETVGLFTCELCDCSRVRFAHVMRNEDFYEDITVGCVCAGIMEGDILAAKERDRKIRNRAKRRMNFPKRQWRRNWLGGYFLTYKGELVFINHSQYNENHYGVSHNGVSVWQYKGKSIDNFISAAYAAFDLVDPVEEYSL